MEFQQEVIEVVCEGLPECKKPLIRAIVEENMELGDKLNKATKLHSTTVEEFKQERYSLKNKLETMTNMEKHYTEEISGLQEQLQKLKSSSADSKQHEAEISKLKLKIEGLTSQIENLHTSEKELQQKLQDTENLFAEYKEEVENVTDQKSLMISEDYLQLQTQVTTLQENTERLESELKESDNHVKALLTENEALKSLLVSQGEDIEQMRCEITSYTNTLERCREENMEYKVLLESMQMEKSEHGEKGNSLFGELDDRRVKAETQLVSLLNRVGVVTQQLTKEKRQYHRLKVQMTTLLQANSDPFSDERLSRSNATISELKAEKETLLNKLKQLEASQVTMKEMMENLLELQKNPPGEGTEDEQQYANFLKAVINTKEQEIASLKKEIHQQNFKLLYKDEKVIDANRKIYTLESKLDKAQKKSLKQAWKIEELIMKYEPETVESTPSIKQGKTEKIPMKLEDDPNHVLLRESILPTSKLSNSKQHDLNVANDNNISVAGSVCESIQTTEVASPEDCSVTESGLSHGKQVKIGEEVVMISSQGEKEKVALAEENKDKKENFRAPKKSRVHPHAKKISSSNTTYVDKSQCKQQ